MEPSQPTRSLVKMWHDHYFHHTQISTKPSTAKLMSIKPNTQAAIGKLWQQPKSAKNPSKLRFLALQILDSCDFLRMWPWMLQLHVAHLWCWAQCWCPGVQIDIIDHLYVAFKAVRMKFRLLQWLFSSFRLKACVEIEFGPETWDKCSLRALSSERNRRWFNMLAGLAWILPRSIHIQK